jgi:tight adherence protein B
MNNLFLLSALAVFGALFLVGLELTRPRLRRRHLAAELGVKPRETARSRANAFGTQATAIAERALEHYDRDGRLGIALDRAGMNMRPAEFVAIAAVATAVAAFVLLLFAGPLIALGVGALVPVGFRITVTTRGRKRRTQLDDQLSDALQTIVGGLRAGHSLIQSIDNLAHEAESPIRDEFERVLFESRLGHPVPVALRNVAARMGSEDFDRVAEAIEIQHEVGGDLAELLESVMNMIRDRRRVGRQIRTLTAEGRLSGSILLCLPLAMFGFLALANRPYMHELTGTGGGKIVLAIAAVLMIVGAIWLRRITRLLY